MRALPLRMARPREEDDAEMVALARAYYEELARHDPWVTPSPTFDATYAFVLERSRATPGHGFLLARLSGRPAGFVSWFAAPEPAFAGPVRGYLSDLYVAPHARRRGVGRRLAGEALARLRDAGAQAIQLSVYPGNAAAVGFWRKLGFETFMLRMRLPEPEPEPEPEGGEGG